MTGGEADREVWWEADLEAELEHQVEQGDGQEEAGEQRLVATPVGVLE